jgi:hypothetical protein
LGYLICQAGSKVALATQRDFGVLTINIMDRTSGLKYTIRSENGSGAEKLSMILISRIPLTGHLK